MGWGVRSYPGVDALLHDRITLFPVCPEVELGLGVPREAIGLERHEGGTRLVVLSTRLELTDAMHDLCLRKAISLQQAGIHGYIARAKSPSCGHGTTPLRDVSGQELERVDGVFVAVLRQLIPSLPVIDDVGLEDESRRRTFIASVKALVGL